MDGSISGKSQLGPSTIRRNLIKASDLSASSGGAVQFVTKVGPVVSQPDFDFDLSWSLTLPI